MDTKQFSKSDRVHQMARQDQIMTARNTRGGPLRIWETATESKLVNMIAYLLTGWTINECGPRVTKRSGQTI